MADDDWAPAAASPLAEVTGTGPRSHAELSVPGYTDLREVARGGDSIVYRARQVSIDRDVAIKVIQVADAGAPARFERELDITLRLGRQHPHIVTVLDTTTASTGEPCLVMEFYDLGSLHDRLRATGPLPVSDVVAAGTAVADALAFAHSRGVLHRDVKPQNVLLLPTSYVLSDFGIARMADAGHTATLERFSYRHASPQVLDGLAPTAADDVWSLGSTLFTLLDGRAPFAAVDPAEDTALSYLRRVRTDERRTLQRDDVPHDLRALLEDALVPDREHRLATAEQALRRLRRIRTEERSWDPAPPPAPEPDVATRPRPAELSDPLAGAPVSPATPAAPPAAPVAAEPAEPAERSGPSHPADHGDAAWAPGATPSPAPATAAPEPAHEAVAVAPSVLAHLHAAPPAREADPEPDGDHTGLAPEPEEDDEPRRRGKGAGKDGGKDAEEIPPWRRVGAFLGGALLVGAAVGIGAAVIRGMGDGEEPETTEPPSTGSVPSGETPDGQPPDVTVTDPDYSPRQVAIDDDRGTSIVVSWTPPEQDVDLYVIIRTDVDPMTVQQYVTPPLTGATIEGLSPDAEECFRIVGMPADPDADNGLSEEICS